MSFFQKKKNSQETAEVFNLISKSSFIISEFIGPAVVSTTFRNTKLTIVMYAHVLLHKMFDNFQYKVHNDRH